MIRTVAASVLLLLTVATPALAYPPGSELTLTCEVSVAVTGSTITCTAGNVEVDVPVTIVVEKISAEGPTLGVQQSSMSSTSVDKMVQLPSEPGTYRITATAGGESSSTIIKVMTQAQLDFDSTDTPSTGARNAGLGALAGLLAFVTGSLLVGITNRKVI